MAVGSQASLTEGYAQGTAPMRSFSIQYLSLILIILTFTIGVFAAHKIDGDKRKIVEEEMPPPELAKNFPDQYSEPTVASIGAMNLDGLFVRGASEMDSVMVDSLAEVLLAHDIDAKFIVGTPKDVAASDVALGIALGRSAVLFRALLERGVPSDAINVMASDEKEGPAVSITFDKPQEAQ